MPSATPLTDRIEARRNTRIGLVAPVPVQLDSRRSEFSKRLAEKRLPVKVWMHDGCGPDGQAA